MTWIDLLGYAASATVLATFCMQTMMPLRLTAILSNILFASFGLWAHIYPVMILHLILFPVNALRLLQIRRLVRGTLQRTDFITAPRSPWQNPYAERLIGSIRRECLDHVIIFNEHHLRRVLSSYFQYHHDTRTHLSLGKDCPRPRRVHLPSIGNIIAFPEVGGLHHRYERRAA